MSKLQDTVTQYTDALARKVHVQKGTPISQEYIDQTDKTMVFDAKEHHVFQNLKSEAHTLGRLSDDDAQWIYMQLGDSVDVVNSKPLAVRIVLTIQYQLLLDWKIKLKRKGVL